MIRTLFLLFIVLCSLCAPAQKIESSLSYSVNLPVSGTEHPPVLILLHGYGSNENDLLEMPKSFDKDFVTFSLRAPFKTANGGFSWYDVEFLHDGEIKYTYSQLKQSREKILGFISKACRAYKADSSRVYVLGFSQGAIVAYDLAISSPKKIRGIVSLSGRLADESKVLKTDWTQVAKLKIFIAHGRSDNVIRYADSEKAFAFFKEKKVLDLTFRNYEMPHSISGGELNDIRAWLSKAIR
jgi:phospholipase/carboxylesterase